MVRMNEFSDSNLTYGHLISIEKLWMQSRQSLSSCLTLTIQQNSSNAWWRHQMETVSVLLAICAGNSPVTGEFPAQRPVKWSFDASFNLRMNKWLSKQWWDWWFETPSRPLWRHCNRFSLSRPAQCVITDVSHMESPPPRNNHFKKILTSMLHIYSQLKAIDQESLYIRKESRESNKCGPIIYKHPSSLPRKRQAITGQSFGYVPISPIAYFSQWA